MSFIKSIAALRPLLRRPGPSSQFLCPLRARPFSRPVSTSSTLHYAIPTTPTSSSFDPREAAAQEALSLGTAALEASDLPLAATHYLTSISIKPTSIAFYNLGVVKYQSSDLAGAIDNFLKSLALIEEGEKKDGGLKPGEEQSYPPTTKMIVKADTLTNLGAAYILSDPPRPDLALA